MEGSESLLHLDRDVALQRNKAVLIQSDQWRDIVDAQINEKERETFSVDIFIYGQAGKRLSGAKEKGKSACV